VEKNQDVLVVAEIVMQVVGKALWAVVNQEDVTADELLMSSCLDGGCNGRLF